MDVVHSLPIFFFTCPHNPNTDIGQVSNTIAIAKSWLSDFNHLTEAKTHTPAAKTHKNTIATRTLRAMTHQ
jgi:hypothetical protein